MMFTVVVSMLLSVSCVSDQSDHEKRDAAPQTQASTSFAFDAERLSHHLVVKPEPFLEWKPKAFLTTLREHPEPAIRTPRDDLKQLLNDERLGDGFSRHQRYTFYSIR